MHLTLLKIENHKQTKTLIEIAQGKILLIDEAYNLDDNLYVKQVLDILVEKIQSKPGSDIFVILAGYKGQMLKMLREQNPGLSSRFDPKFVIEFEDYDDDELLEILSRELNKSSKSYEMLIEVRIHAIKELSKRRALAYFVNARTVQTLIANEKTLL